MARVALIQSNAVGDDVQKNHDLLTSQICEATCNGARLIVLPEMFNTGFSLPVGELAERANREGVDFLIRESKRHNVTIIGSLPDPRDHRDRPFNTMFVVGPSGIVCKYDKIHLFSYGGETEKYRAGNQTVTVQIEDLRVSLFICYDLRFADVIFPLANLTDLFIFSANWPSSRQLHWETMLRARAIENLAYVVGVNRVGRIGNLEFSGGSQVVSPLGDIIAHGQSGEGISYADIDAEEIQRVRKTFPFLLDRNSK